MSEYKHDDGEYNAAKAISKAIQTDVFKEHLFDPDDISLADMSTTLLESGLADDLEGFNMEFHLGYGYMLWRGIPFPDFINQDFGDRLGRLERTVEELSEGPR